MRLQILPRLSSPFIILKRFCCFLSSILGSYHSMSPPSLLIMSLLVFHENLTKVGNPKFSSRNLLSQILDFGSLGYPQPKSWSNWISLETASLNTHYANNSSLETFATILAADTTGYLSSAFDSDFMIVSCGISEPHLSRIYLTCRAGGPS